MGTRLVRVEQECAVEPGPCLVKLAVVPEELRNGGNDVGVIVATLERIHRTTAPLWPRHHRHRLCPQPPARPALLLSIASCHAIELDLIHTAL